jgi:hypothetical protein
MRNYWILLHINQFEISASQRSTRYSPARNGDMLKIVVHKNVRLSEAITSDILDSDHYQSLSTYWIIFTDWERFQSLASELI